jgi:hypothetical protein
VCCDVRDSKVMCQRDCRTHLTTTEPDISLVHRGTCKSVCARVRAIVTEATVNSGHAHTLVCERNCIHVK